MDRLELYKTLYFEELRRREDLRGALALPIGILTVLGGVTAVYLREMVQVKVMNGPVALLLLGTVLLVGSFILTVSHLIRSYHGYQYDYLPYATELEFAYQELASYYASEGAKGKGADLDFEASLMERLVSAQQKNAFNNDLKSSHLYNANQTLIYALVLALLSAIPFFLVSQG